jgi:predicted  nucleic acid-binding Zn-ribbon protein
MDKRPKKLTLRPDKAKSNPPTPREDASPSGLRRINSASALESSDYDRSVSLALQPKSSSALSGETSNVQVAIRIRPITRRESERGSRNITTVLDNKIEICDPKGASMKGFQFDNVYSCDSQQDDVYNDIGIPIVGNAFDGYNCCILAYGQTGSGKTHTMMGEPEDEGIIPRIARELISRAQDKAKAGDEWDYHLEVSYMEIYAEKIYDLLARGGDSEPLKIRHHSKTGPYVENLRKFAVDSYEDIQKFINKGNKHRTTAATDMNERSSRSHAIFTITFKQFFYKGADKKKSRETVSTLYLVDLAGSERVEASGVTGVNLNEAIAINQSLMTLGMVITKLVRNQKMKVKEHIPFRDSALTWILSDALGGNSKTCMIATISPADINYNESLSTLRYADNAKKIINTVSINEQMDNDLISALQIEITDLRVKLSQKSENSGSIEDEINMRQRIIDELSKSWEQQLQYTRSANEELSAQLITEKKQVENLQSENQSLSTELHKILAERDKTTRDVLDRIQQSEAEYQKRIADMKKEIISLHKSLEEKTSELEAKSRETQVNPEALDDMRRQLDQYKYQLDKSNTLAQILTDEIAENKIRIEELDATIDTYKLLIQQAQDKINLLDSKLSEATSERDWLEQQLSIEKKATTDMMAEIERLAEEKDDSDSNFSRITEQNQSLIAQIRKARSNITALQTKILDIMSIPVNDSHTVEILESIQYVESVNPSTESLLIEPTSLEQDISPALLMQQSSPTQQSIPVDQLDQQSIMQSPTNKQPDQQLQSTDKDELIIPDIDDTEIKKMSSALDELHKEREHTESYIDELKKELADAKSEALAARSALESAVSESNDLRSIIEKIKLEHGDVYATLQQKDSILSDRERKLLDQKEKIDSLTKTQAKQINALMKLRGRLRTIRDRVVVQPNNQSSPESTDSLVTQEQTALCG